MPLGPVYSRFTVMDLFSLYACVSLSKIMALRSAGSGDRYPVDVVQTLALNDDVRRPECPL
jgi:hypothetical protein